MNLKELGIGETAVIESVGGEGSLRQHFLDMGVIPGAEITLEKYAPMGDPMELRIHSYELTLRVADAEKIEIKPVQKNAPKKSGIIVEPVRGKEHPGIGEDGIYHNKNDEIEI